jgi:hypothetical protein
MLLQIVVALRAVQQPSSIPISLASLHLMQGASYEFTRHISRLLEETGTFSKRLSSLRKLFEAESISNKVTDGTIPFPENEQSLRDGISLEFRCPVYWLHIIQDINVTAIFSGVCHFDIPTVRGMSCATFRLNLGQANFAYAYPCHNIGRTTCL